MKSILNPLKLRSKDDNNLIYTISITNIFRLLKYKLMDDIGWYDEWCQI